MWVCKTAGETYYVEHVTCNVPWTTKETPDNSHTKGSLKVKNCILAIDDDNCANITALTFLEKIRLKNQDKGYTRIIWRNPDHKIMTQTFKTAKIKHSPVKKIIGNCGTSFYMTDVYEKVAMSYLILAVDSNFKTLLPNDPKYKMYDDPKQKFGEYYDEVNEYDDDDDDDE